MRSPLQVTLFALALFVLFSRAQASRQGDSLQTAVDGVSSSAERANALLAMARAQANAQPGESLQRVTTAMLSSAAEARSTTQRSWQRSENQILAFVIANPTPE